MRMPDSHVLPLPDRGFRYFLALHYGIIVFFLLS